MCNTEYREKYKKAAVDLAIKYAAEQGVKLRRTDFSPYNSNNHNGNLVDFWDLGTTESVEVFITGDKKARWAAQLKRAEEGFLNYVNARVLKEGIRFSFTTREIDILSIKKAEPGEEERIENVIKKITKLLALSDMAKNPSENEAIAASLKAQQLLAKYNLSMVDITGERQKEEIEQVIADVGTGNKWKYELANVVADNYAVKTFYYSDGSRIVFFGYKADVLIARRVFIYLFKVGNRLAKQYVKRYREEVCRYADGVYNSFVRGFTNGVQTELERQCTALALVCQPEVQEKWDIYSANFKSVNNTVTLTDPVAYSEGVIEGKRALNAQYIED